MTIKNQNSVEKALSQEAQTILSNIGSLLQELQAAEGGSTPPAAKDDTGNPPIQDASQVSAKGEDGMTDEERKQHDAAKAAEDKKKEDEAKANKDITATPSDSSTASDDAETRLIDTLTEVDEENVEAVKKAIRTAKAILAAKKASAPASVVKGLNDLTAVVTQIARDQIGVQKALSAIFEATGITKQIEESIKAEKSAVSGKPIIDQNNADTLKFLQTIQKSLQGNQDGEKPATDQRSPMDNSTKIRKNLEVGLSMMFPLKK
jgi:hypothetical protein